jgi:beta-lactamase class A
MRRPALRFALAFFSVISLQAASLDIPGLERELATLTKSFNGRVGVCVQDGANVACNRGDERFSLQSVVKLLVGIAAADAADHRVWRLDDPVTIYKKDLSMNVQPIKNLVGSSGFRTTIGDLIRRAIIDSDSATSDYLMAKLGGPAAVQKELTRMGMSGIRVDRDERHLQTETQGLTWRSEFVDTDVLDKARAALTDAAKERAYLRYQKDPRDTSTPRGMASFLDRLQRGKLLSPESTAFILQAMEDCKTFPDRIKAGAAPGWKVAHKTGSSGTWNELTVATNDVGVLTSPSGGRLSIAVFVADSRASDADRAAIMAKITAAAIARYK